MSTAIDQTFANVQLNIKDGSIIDPFLDHYQPITGLMGSIIRLAAYEEGIHRARK
ncbi:hypothetical protein Ancab_035771, partial [Ancistrocladus abbreviatus]